MSSIACLANLGDTEIVVPREAREAKIERIGTEASSSIEGSRYQNLVHSSEKLDFLEKLVRSSIRDPSKPLIVTDCACSTPHERVERLMVRFSNKLGGEKSKPRSVAIISSVNELLYEIPSWTKAFDSSIPSRVCTKLLWLNSEGKNLSLVQAYKMISMLLPWLDPFAELGKRWLSGELLLLNASRELSTLISQPSPKSLEKNLARFLAKTVMEIYQPYLHQEFKLHLNPREGSIPTTLQAVLAWRKESPLANQSVVQIKCSTSPHNHNGEFEPTFIIYVGSYEMSPSKGAKLAKALTAELSQVLTKIGIKEVQGCLPRFSCPASPLVYLAQSSGDIKHKLAMFKDNADVSLLDHYFDPKMQHAVFKQEVGLVAWL